MNTVENAVYVAENAVYDLAENAVYVAENAVNGVEKAVNGVTALGTTIMHIVATFYFRGDMRDLCSQGNLAMKLCFKI